MSALTATLTHNGVEYDAQIATIEDTLFGEEDHGIWTVILYFAAGGWQQGTSARGLDQWDDEQQRRIGSAFGMDHVMAIVRTLGCRNWENVKGLRCLVLRKRAYGLIEGIADLEGERVLIFDEHAAAWFPEAVQS